VSTVQQNYVIVPCATLPVSYRVFHISAYKVNGLQKCETPYKLKNTSPIYNPCILGKIRQDAKSFMSTRRQKSRSPSDDPNAEQNLEMQTGEPTERGYAFSQEEHGAVSQNELVRAYSRAESRRYGSGKNQNASTSKMTSITSSNQNSQLGM
jgi:hypothetical protein